LLIIIEYFSSVFLKKDANIRIDIRNPQSDFEVRDNIVIDPTQYLEQEESSREPPYHFAIKWEGSKKRSVIEVLDDDAVKTALKKNKKMEFPRALTEDDSGKFVPVLALECRGIEPYAYHPMGGEFVIVSKGGKKFSEDVDLSEGDWGDYDEENDMSVSVSDFESKFIVA